jgi:hypothetical protein
MNDKRGFHFLVGLAVLWLLWRLYAAGIIFQVVYYALGDETVVANGPGAIIVAFVIEAVITIGWVVTLLTSGIWDGLLVLGRFVSDGFGAAHSYAVAAQAEGDVAVVSTADEETEPTYESVPHSLETQVRLAQIIGAKQGKTPEQIAIEVLSIQLADVANRLPPVAEVAE